MGLIGRVWAEIGGDATGLKKAANEAKQSLNSIKQEAVTTSTQAESSLGGITTALGAVTTAAGIAVTAFAVLKAGFDFSEEGAQMVSLQMASSRLATSYDANMASIVTSVKKASMNTISEYDIMKSANLALTMGVSKDATEIAQLMQIAIERGRAFGLTSEEAFDRITRGIGRRSTKILDDLGFTANAIEANKAYADSLGISTNALTDDMKVRALAIQILKEGNAQLAKQGGLVEDIYTPYQQVNTVIDEFWNNVKTGAAFAFLPVIASKEQTKAINDEAASYAILNSNYSKYIQASRRAAQGGAYVDKNGNLVQQGQGALSRGQFGEAQRYTAMAIAYKNASSGVQDYTDSLDDNYKSMLLEAGLTGEIAKAQEKYNDTLEKYGKRSKKTAEASEELKTSLDGIIYSLANANDEMSLSVSAQLKLSEHLGLIDKESLIAQAALDSLNEQFDANKSGVLEASEMTAEYLGLVDALKGVFTDTSASWTLKITMLVNGGVISPKMAASLLGTSSGIITSGMNYSGLASSLGYSSSYGNSVGRIPKTGGLHGGSFIGLQHGGIVPAGYGNDSMPIWVSSGERVDVTPAGNKSVQGQSSNTYKFYGPVTFKVDKNMKESGLISELRQ